MKFYTDKALVPPNLTHILLNVYTVQILCI